MKWQNKEAITKALRQTIAYLDAIDSDLLVIACEYAQDDEKVEDSLISIARSCGDTASMSRNILRELRRDR